MKTHFKNILLVALTAFTCAGTLATAQDKSTDKNQPTDVSNSVRRFWEATLPGGNYMVALDRLSSISMHSYIIAGGITVFEVNIETNGAALARFYAIEATGERNESNVAKNLINRGRSLVDQAGKRGGVDTNTTVQKEYATTTHAKTIEYRVFQKSDLDRLYASVKRAWKENRGRKFTIK